MSRPRFLADHNLREPILKGVLRREPAVEIVRAREVGLEQRKDEEVLAFAAREGLLVLTHDKQTMIGFALGLISRGDPMKGLFEVKTALYLRKKAIEDIILVWACSEAEEWDSIIRFIPFP